VASSWNLFFSYQDDARSNTHQISESNLTPCNRIVIEKLTVAQLAKK